MKRRNRIWAALAAGTAGLVGLAAAQAQQGGSTATYWMSAETSSGMATGMAGGQPDPQAMMRAMTGGGAAHGKSLLLQLDGGRRASGAPSAEHLPPGGLGAGPSLPLLTPQAARPEPTGTPSLPQGMERPRGRMLVYWGCGERARAGQPAVIDFAALQAGQVPAAFANANIRTMTPPAPGRAVTYGEWPNERARTRVPAEGSLVGDHVVRGNYTPEIRFTLGQGQDFLAPVTVTGNQAGASGAVPIGWRPVPGARAWFVTAMGAARNGDVILWSSSERQIAPMLMDYLPQDEIARLVREQVLLPGEATQCTVPAEVARAGEGAMLTVTALGGETNFSHPARPANAGANWRPEWTVKLRTRSTHMGLLGMDMGAMMGGAEEEEEDRAERQRERRDRNPLRRGLGRILGQ